MRPAPLALCALLCLAARPLVAQQTPSALPADSAAEAPRLFLDCVNAYCDPDFYRTEINFVNHVRSRQDADIHVLITPQQTGGGGTEYTLNFIGQRRFAGRSDTLRFVSPPASTEDDRRRGLARLIKVGLMPYLAGTPLASRFDITYRAPEGGEKKPAAAVRDPWNYWTFRSRVNGFFQGESRQRFGNMFGQLSANRITEDWKIQFSANGDRSTSFFETSETTSVTSEQHGYGLSSLVARSLGPHLSAGVRASAQASTYLNQDMRLRFAPAVEYNVFPYAESTRRQLTAQYSVGANRFDFTEVTIFGETTRSMADHSLLVSLDQKQRWGSMSVAMEAAQYLHDPKRYRGDVFGDADVRLFKGFSLNLYGQLAYIRDQIYLPAGGATPEEILLRLRQLETSYRYFGQVGISYTFGSIYNNVVNPRFTAGRGGF